MSLDFKIQNNCDHYINWESVEFPLDRKTISPSYPIGSITSFIIRINNVIIDPSKYTISLNKNDMVLFPKSIVVLKEPCLLFYPIIEMKYTTLKQYCPKCAGSRTLDDFIYGPDKDVVTAGDELLLIQTLEKLIVTQLTSNKYYDWVGTSIHTLIGSKITDIDYFKAKISEDVKKSIDDLKKIENQYISTGRAVTEGELFGELLDIIVSQSKNDPTMLEILIKFTAQSGKVIELQQLVQLSQVRNR
jgi:hypothetical protein